MRVVIFTSAQPSALGHLLWRLRIDAPEIDVAGVLYETGRPPLPRAQRVRRLARLARDREFISYIGWKACRSALEAAEAAADRALRWLHAAPAEPNGPAPSLESVVAEAAARNIRFHITRD